MKKLFLLLIFIMILTGCGEKNEIQNEAYAIGMGLEYIEDEYKIILLFLDFSNVAKTEQGKSEQPGQVFLGTGHGKTIEDAIADITKGTQLPINYDQINLFVFSKSILEQDIEKILLALDSNFNIRLTGMTYGTDESIVDIFTSKVPFNYPYTSSRIVQPEYMQSEQSTIPPMTLQEFIYQLNERTKTVILPAVELNDQLMKEGMENLLVTTISGAYLIKDMKLRGYLTNDDMKGYIRVNNNSVQTTMALIENEMDNQYVQIELSNPKISRSMKITEDKRILTGLEIKVGATILESDEDIHVDKIKRRIEERIIEEVYDAYNKSHELGADIYQMEEYLYRYQHKTWKRFMNNESIPELKKDDIHVTIEPLNTIHKSKFDFSKKFK